jgi:PAS domain S-box-containing protein
MENTQSSPQWGDVAAHKRAEQERARLAAVLDSTDDAIISKNLQGIITSWNAGAEKLFGYKADEILGHPISRIIPPDLQPEEWAILNRIRQGKVLHHNETVRVHKSGRLIPVAITIVPLRDPTGTVVGASKIARDISDRKRAEEAIHSSEIRYRRLFEASREGILLLDAQTKKITDANPFISDLLGYPRRQLLGKELWEIGLLKDRDAHRDALRKLDEKGQLTYDDLPLRIHTGQVREVEFVSSRYAEDGHSVIQCNIRDITERKRAEAVQKHFRALFESAPGAYLVLIPENYEIAAVSDSYLRATLTERQNIMGKGLFEVFPDVPGDSAATGVRNLRASLERVKATRRTDVMAVQRYPIARSPERGGGFEERWWSPINAPVFGPRGDLAYIIHRVEDVTDYVRARQRDGKLAEGLQTLDSRVESLETDILLRAQELQQANDQLRQFQEQLEQRVRERTAELAQANENLRQQIAEREKAEYELRAGEERFRLLVEGVKDYAIFMLDAQGRVATWNAGAEHIKGYRAEEIIGKPYSCFFTDEDICDGKPERELAFAAAQGRFNDETWRVRKDETRFWASISLTALHGADGKLIGFSKVTRDMTERRRMEEALREANGNLQNFAHTAAHDLRSPLRTINSFAGLLQNDLQNQLGPENLDMLNRIIKAAAHMGHLLNDLLEYSRMTQAELPAGPVNLQEATAEALFLLDSEIRARNATVSVQENLPQVKGHASTVVLLINNLVANALKFVPGDRQPQIKIGTELCSAPGSSGGDLIRGPSSFNPQSAHSVRLWVQDNGIGIAPEHLSQIFGLFQRLHGKQAFPGTGLGLAIVKKGAERMGGRVGVESQVDSGSRFWIELPIIGAHDSRPSGDKAGKSG